MKVSFEKVFGEIDDYDQFNDWLSPEHRAGSARLFGIRLIGTTAKAEEYVTHAAAGADLNHLVILSDTEISGNTWGFCQEFFEDKPSRWSSITMSRHGADGKREELLLYVFTDNEEDAVLLKLSA